MAKYLYVKRSNFLRGCRKSELKIDTWLADDKAAPMAQRTYVRKGTLLNDDVTFFGINRVFHGYRLTYRDDYFRVTFDHF